jgi:hypothetical protein
MCTIEFFAMLRLEQSLEPAKMGYVCTDFGPVARGSDSYGVSLAFDRLGMSSLKVCFTQSNVRAHIGLCFIPEFSELAADAKTSLHHSVGVESFRVYVDAHCPLVRTTNPFIKRDNAFLCMYSIGTSAGSKCHMEYLEVHAASSTHLRRYSRYQERLRSSWNHVKGSVAHTLCESSRTEGVYSYRRSPTTNRLSGLR